MKTDFSKLPRAELEARITEMLLGEMSPAEATALREFIANDAELARLAQELEKTIGLVTEAVSARDEKISSEKREELLASFKVVKPAELSKKRAFPLTWFELATVAAIIALMASLSVSGLRGFTKSRSSSVAMRGREELEERASDPSKGEKVLAGDPEPIGVLERPVPATGLPARDMNYRFSDTDTRAKSQSSAGTRIELPALAAADEPAFGRANSSLQGGRSAGGLPGTGGNLPPADVAPLDKEAAGKNLGFAVSEPSGATTRGFSAFGADQSGGFSVPPGEPVAGLEAVRRKPLERETAQERGQSAGEVQGVRSLMEKGKTVEVEKLLTEVLEDERDHLRSAQTPGQQVALGLEFKETPEPPAAVPAKPAQVLADVLKKSDTKLGKVGANVQLSSDDLTQQGARKDLARVDRLGRGLNKQELELAEETIVMAKRAITPAAVPQPEVPTSENAFSTFSLNVSDVSFKLAAASLERGQMPEAGTVRSEEFINAFDYRDPEPQGAPVGFTWERARYPFAQDRDLLRLSVKTAAKGREAGRPLNLVLLLDSSGSMERADRVRILRECLRTLGTQLRAEDRVSVVAFARTARLWVDGLAGSQAGELAGRVGELAPEGGTNLEEAMRVAYETARKHFLAGGVNRVVLLTDGAANLGDVEPESLKRKVEAERKRGVALDCFGIGWEGLNDALLETLSRNGDGRYGFVNTPEAAASEFAGQLAGALQVAASDVKVQVEWNPKRVTAYRQIGYAKHQLTKEQFRDNTVDAAEIGAAEAGNALYVVQVNAAGEGPLGTVRVRFKVPGTNDYREHAWPLAYEGAVKPLENASYSLRLAGAASAFSEWLVSSPYAAEVTTDRLLGILSGVPEHFGPDPRPKKLEWMVRQAKSLTAK